MHTSTLQREVLALALTVGALACTNGGSDLGFGESKTTAVSVIVYLDRDGSRTLTALDTAFATARVALLAPGTGDTIRTAISSITVSIAALARFDGVPLGEYRVAIVPASIGDSIEVAAIDSANIRLNASDTNRVVLARLGYPEVSIRAARGLPVGRRVFIRGVILAGVQSFRDVTSHITDSSMAIRLTRVVLKGGLTGNNPGDSVSVLGITSTLLGQPTLDLAAISRFATRPPPIPAFISSASAATASGGVLDAGLVQVSSVVISDTVTVAPDFQVTVSDGTGALKIILDANLPFPRSVFQPGRSMNVRGVLVPDGLGKWNLKPRDLGDVVFN